MSLRRDRPRIGPDSNYLIKKSKMSSALEQLKASGTIVVADSGEIEKVSSIH